VTVQIKARKVRTHFKDDDRYRQRGGDPEAPRHVDQFGAGAGYFADADWFQRHAADRAGARSDLPDLRMHRASVDRAFRRRRRLGVRLFKVLLRIGDELAAAGSGAEEVGMVL